MSTVTLWYPTVSGTLRPSTLAINEPRDSWVVAPSKPCSQSGGLSTARSFPSASRKWPAALTTTFASPGPISSTGVFSEAVTLISPDAIRSRSGWISSTSDPGPRTTSVSGANRHRTALAPRTSVRSQSPSLSNTRPATGVQRECIAGRNEAMPWWSVTLPMRPSRVSMSPMTNNSSGTSLLVATTLIRPSGSRLPSRRATAESERSFCVFFSTNASSSIFSAESARSMR